MGMFGEIAIEGCIQEIINKLLPLYRAAEGPAKEAYRRSILTALTCFDWNTPVWAIKLEKKLETENAKD